MAPTKPEDRQRLNEQTIECLNDCEQIFKEGIATYRFALSHCCGREGIVRPNFQRTVRSMRERFYF